MVSRLIAIAALALAGCATGALPRQTEVMSFIDRLTAAGVKRDVAVLKSLYAPDYFHTNADGSVMTLDRVLQSYASPPAMTILSSTHDEERMQFMPGAALVNMRVAINGVGWTRRFRVTYVVAREHGRWVAKNSHASALASP